MISWTCSIPHRGLIYFFGIRKIDVRETRWLPSVYALTRLGFEPAILQCWSQCSNYSKTMVKVKNWTVLLISSPPSEFNKKEKEKKGNTTKEGNTRVRMRTRYSVPCHFYVGFLWFLKKTSKKENLLRLSKLSRVAKLNWQKQDSNSGLCDRKASGLLLYHSDRNISQAILVRMPLMLSTVPQF